MEDKSINQLAKYFTQIYIKKSNNIVDKIHDIESFVNCANFYANAYFLYYTFYIICLTNKIYTIEKKV